MKKGRHVEALRREQAIDYLGFPGRGQGPGSGDCFVACFAADYDDAAYQQRLVRYSSQWDFGSLQDGLWREGAVGKDDGEGRKTFPSKKRLRYGQFSPGPALAEDQNWMTSGPLDMPGNEVPVRQIFGGAFPYKGK